MVAAAVGAAAVVLVEAAVASADSAAEADSPAVVEDRAGDNFAIGANAHLLM